MPLLDARHPVLQFLGEVPEGLPRVVVEPVVIEQCRELHLGHMLELLHPGGHQVVDHAHRPVLVDVEELLDDQHHVVELTFELDLLLVGEDVVREARVIGRGVLQGP